VNLVNPQLSIEIENQKKLHLRFSALLDTGYNGFISIPKAVAKKLDLKPKGIKSVSYGSGDIYDEIVTSAYIYFEDLVYEADLLVTEGDDILLGTRFLTMVCLSLDKDLVFSFRNQEIRFE
jgi:clan AA aspartic protease